MTNPIAFALAALLFAFGVGDYLFNDGASLLYLVKKFLDLVAYVQFWR